MAGNYWELLNLPILYLFSIGSDAYGSSAGSAGGGRRSSTAPGGGISGAPQGSVKIPHPARSARHPLPWESVWQPANCSGGLRPPVFELNDFGDQRSPLQRVTGGCHTHSPGRGQDSTRGSPPSPLGGCLRTGKSTVFRTNNQ